jgi:hypothetical protein
LKKAVEFFKGLDWLIILIWDEVNSFSVLEKQGRWEYVA